MNPTVGSDTHCSRHCRRRGCRKGKTWGDARGGFFRFNWRWSLQIEEAQVPRRTTENKPTFIHILVQFQNTENKDKISNKSSQREEWWHSEESQVTAGFSASSDRNMEKASICGNWENGFKHHNSLWNTEGIKPVPEFTNSRPLLRQNLKDTFPKQNKITQEDALRCRKGKMSKETGQHTSKSR